MHVAGVVLDDEQHAPLPLSAAAIACLHLRGTRTGEDLSRASGSEQSGADQSGAAWVSWPAPPPEMMATRPGFGRSEAGDVTGIQTRA